jgi:CBS domain-containing membrane protein
MARPKVVGDIMTRRVLYLFEEQNLETIERGMKQFHFRHLPVVDDGKLVGIVSERDYLRASVSSLDPDHDLKDDNLKRNLFVAEVMTRDVTSVRPSTSLTEAARLLSDHKFGCLPVTAEDGTLVGIVTDSDFVKLALELLQQSDAPAAVALPAQPLR